jgi:hypothetical protein
VARHFYNAACPESPFADAEALRDDLRHCVHASSREVPGVEWVQCGSWVNNLPPFQSLFPPAYVASMVATRPEAKTGCGWWGQFVTSEGSLTEARARRLLEVDEFTTADAGALHLRAR